jgi:hypothetical protein
LHRRQREDVADGSGVGFLPAVDDEYLTGLQRVDGLLLMIPDMASSAKLSGSSTVSRVDYAHRTIRERIIGGTYGPGYRLVLEELARGLGVSTVPVREAVRRLEAEGYVDFQRNIGARVASFDERELSRPPCRRAAGRLRHRAGGSAHASQRHCQGP